MTAQERQNLLNQITVIINNMAVDGEMVEKPRERGKVELLTVKECAEAVGGLSECTVRQLVAQNRLPYIRSGVGKRGKILIPKAALLEYFGG